jgi:hypothetical protein
MTTDKNKNVSIIIVNYNGLHFTRQCLESLYRFHGSEDIEVIVVDNNSSDGSQTELPKLYPAIKLIPLSENKGFGTANNIGAKISKGEILFFVNNDTLFLDKTVEKLKKIFSLNTNYGIVSPKLLSEDSSFQLSFGCFPTVGNELYAKRMAESYSLQKKQDISSDQAIEKDWVTGAAFMIRRELFESIGGFDENYFMYFEDIDLCKSIETMKYKSVYIPSVKMIHFGGKSYGKKDDKIVYEYRRSQLRYYDKHNSFFQRIMVRIFIIFKFLPKLFIQPENKLATNILKLVFATHN